MPHFDSKIEDWEEQILCAFFNSTNYYEDDMPDFERVLEIHKEELQESIGCQGECAYYARLKPAIERLLESRDINRIEDIMIKSEYSTPYGEDQEVREKYAALDYQYVERLYYEFYQNDLEFKPDLIQTPFEELLEMEF